MSILFFRSWPTFFPSSRPLLRHSRLLSSSFDATEEKRRQIFLEREAERNRSLNLDSLTPEELRIHEVHRDAVRDFRLSYIDPFTGLSVFTTYKHFLKGKCCGNGCRHCVYGHENVKSDLIKKNRIFNSSFWVDKAPSDR